MSYILDTLKKLDKEKSEFDGKLNLKELIVKDDSALDAVKSLKRRNYLLTFLAVVFALFFIQNFYSDNYLNTKQNIKPNIGAESKLIVKHAPEKASLSSLPANPEIQVKYASLATNATEKNQESMKLEIRKKTNSSEIEVIQKQEINKKENKPEPVYLDSNDNIQQNNSVGKKEVSGKKQNIPVAPEKPMDSTVNSATHQNDVSDKKITEETSPQDILDIKINGIIYFGRNSSLNYALASFKGKDQVKLKAGDYLSNDIEVLEIQSEKIILIFNNKVFEKSLGI